MSRRGVKLFLVGTALLAVAMFAIALIYAPG